MSQFTSDKWIEIDIKALKDNLAAVKSLLSPGVRLIAVVKANAYGHGAVEVARLLQHNGVDFFAVSYLNEALELRNAGIKEKILLFAPLVDEAQVKEAIQHDITLTVASPYDCDLIDLVSSQMNHLATVHLKVDTGLGRFGLKPAETIAACTKLGDNRRIHIEGIYTHMARGASPNPHYTNRQFKAFMAVIEQLKDQGYNIPIKHCANSAVLVKYPHMHLDAVRVGTLISGQYPAGISDRPVPLQDPYKFKCRIISVRTLPKGSYLGYNSTYRLKTDAQVAVIPVGFSDGLALAVANKPAGFVDMVKIIAKTVLGYVNFPRFNLQVTFKGNNYPIRGKVFMQMALVEIPLSIEVNPGDEVELPVRKTLAPASLVRVYTEDGLAVKIGREDRSSYVIGET
ncbi:MAG: alanine racemase [Syntrophomonadaceae bacterium]